MVSQKVTVINPTGLHARPAAVLAREAKQFASEIAVVSGSRKVDAKNVLALMDAGVNGGAEITVECIGADEEEALKALILAIESGLGDEITREEETDKIKTAPGGAESTAYGAVDARRGSFFACVQGCLFLLAEQRGVFQMEAALHRASVEAQERDFQQPCESFVVHVL